MPSRKVHNLIAKEFGIDPRIANEVNAHMDAPARQMGPGHRKVRHDPAYAIFIALNYNGRDRQHALAAAALHIKLDQISQNPEMRMVFKFLDIIDDRS